MVSELRYELIPDWEKRPAGYDYKDAVGVAVDPRDRVYLITRNASRVIIYDRDGTFVTTWGEKIFTPRTHCIRFAQDGCVYTVDDGDHTVRKFSAEGKPLLVLGTPGVASDTGYRPDGANQLAKLATIKQAGPPFNRPTGVAIAPNGDIYVSDGYGNARVHWYSPDGALIRSWGAPGTGPGEFEIPHDIWISPDERVLVADRENNRIQIFSLQGDYLEQWADLQRPTGLYMDRAGLVYVSELAWRVGDHSFTHGPVTQFQPARVSVLDPRGRVLARWGSADPCTPGGFCAPHGLCVDSRGDLYVAEVTHTFAVKLGLVPDSCHRFQKFARR